jgi:hypothetical protein
MIAVIEFSIGGLMFISALILLYRVLTRDREYDDYDE